MPSARIHEAVAKEINKDYNMDELLLRIGTVSPDSWRNVEAGVKDKYLSHFWDFRVKEGQANNYEKFNLKYYNYLSNPFYFGYLIHLIVDQYWKTNIDPKYVVIENGVKGYRLRDGSFHSDENWFGYYDGLKLQRKLAIDVIKRLLFEINGAPVATQAKRWQQNSAGSAKKRMKLILGSDGRNPGTETAEEIWTDLLDDCFDDDEITLIKSVKEKSPEVISRPYYNKTVKIEDTGEEFVANLIWDSKYVILLLNDSAESYELAKKTGWDVYCTKEMFDVDEFLKKVGV